MSKKRDIDSAALENESQAKKRKLFKVPQFSASILAAHSTNLSQPTHSSPPPYNGHRDTLPELPKILNKTLEEVTFTHQGTLTAQTAHDVNMSYERLEFLGDACLELIATRAIFPRFPKLSAGQLSQTRQLLVKNETLADFSLAYGFHERAHLPQDIGPSTGDNSKKAWTKTMGDIFEAYVAAVILSNPTEGFQIVETWMGSLWTPILSNNEESTSLNLNAKSQLAAKIMGKGVKIHYRDQTPPKMMKKEGKILFHIGAYLTGWGWENMHLGSGKGWNKNEAGSHAATQAMANPLTAQVAALKRDFDAKTAQQRKTNDLKPERTTDTPD